jgi:hypothetical protein
MQRKIYALFSAVLLVALLAGGAVAQSPVSEFDTILAERLILTDSLTVPDATYSDDVRVDGDLDAYGVLNVVGHTAMSTFEASGNSNVGGTLAVEGAFSASDNVSLIAQSPITVTNTGTFTVGGGVQLIQAAGSVTPVLNSGVQGQMVTLLNISNQTITLADTTGQLLSANWVGGQWDTLTLYFYGVTWIEVARSNN